MSGPSVAEVFSAARVRIAAYAEAGASGRDLARLYATATDRAVSRLAAAAAGPGFAVVAAGGYGRKEVCPGSDVDLVLLAGAPVDTAFEGRVRALLYPLFDLGLRVGHHPGTVEELLDKGDRDIPTRTALLHLRFLAGDRPLHDRFSTGVGERIPAWAAGLRDACVPAARSRFQRYGDSVFVLEPHVKEGMGGLRDWHWVLWLARVLDGARDPSDLLLSGLVSPRDLAELVAAWDFVLRVRIGMHLLAGRKEDRLVFEHQAALARRLGYRATRKGTAAERLMGDWYRNAFRLSWQASRLVKRLTGSWWDESPGEAAAVVEAEAGLPGPGPDAAPATPVPFRWEGGEVLLAPGVPPPRDPLPFLELFRDLSVHGGRLHPDTQDAVRALPPRAAARLRKDPRAHALFRQVLTGPRRFAALSALHQSGLLDRLVPEFARTYCRAQGSRMHVYTVDVHSLHALRELQALADPLNRRRFPFHAALFDREGAGFALALALLLHDLGKAWPVPNHSLKGAELVGPIAARLGCSADEAAEVEFLVRHHLLLNEVALRRDLSDEATLAAFVGLVGSEPRLDRLVLLTFADMRATHPDLLTRWKESLQQVLYERARARLAGEGAREIATRERAVAEARALLERQAPPAQAARWLDHLLQGLPESFPAHHGPETLAACAALLDPSVKETLRLHRRPTGLGWTEIAVAAPDRPGLFADIAGTLAAHGLDVLGADVHTRPDRWILDLFQVTGPGRDPDVPEPRFRRFAADLDRVLAGRDSASALLSRLRRSPPPPLPSAGVDARVRVEFPDRSPGQGAVVEVTAPDRPGLLHVVARRLFEQGLTIDLARIATSGPLAVDAFYVRDARTGRPVLGERRKQRLRATLARALGDGG